MSLIDERYVKPAVLKNVDPQQYGNVPNSSTTFARMNMVHTWLQSTDGNGSTARVMLFDFRKAFDLVDHNVLVRKLSSYDFPTSVMRWILDFLSNRKQRVKVSSDCFSEWAELRAGVPQGTKLGPWLSLIMINDVKIPDLDLWKYVDGSTMSEIVKKNEASSMQLHVGDFVTQIEEDNFHLNESKCKERE